MRPGGECRVGRGEVGNDNGGGGGGGGSCGAEEGGEREVLLLSFCATQANNRAQAEQR